MRGYILSVCPFYGITGNMHRLKNTFICKLPIPGPVYIWLHVKQTMFTVAEYYERSIILKRCYSQRFDFIHKEIPHLLQNSAYSHLKIIVSKNIKKNKKNHIAIL